MTNNFAGERISRISEKRNWDLYFNERLSSYENRNSLVYAIVLDQKLVYFGKTTNFKSRKNQHLKEIMSNFILRYVSRKASRILQVVASELNDSYIGVPFNILAQRMDTHLSFLEVKGNMGKLEAKVLESELIHRYYDRGPTTNFKKEKLYDDPDLSKRTRDVYIEGLYADACNRAKNIVNLEHFNLWCLFSKSNVRTKLNRRQSDSDELESTRKFLETNGIVEIDSHNALSQTKAYMTKLNYMLQNGSFLKLVKSFTKEIAIMLRLKKPVKSESLYIPNPIFVLSARFVNRVDESVIIPSDFNGHQKECQENHETRNEQKPTDEIIILSDNEEEEFLANDGIICIEE